MDIRQIVHSVWPDWDVIEAIGEGNFGTVYRVRRGDIVGEADAAIKVTVIPQDSDELDSLRMEGLSEEQSRSYLKGIVQDLAAEIRLMSSVKGYTNIVSIEDYKVIEHRDRVAWTIFIRMELLTPLSSRIAEKPLAEREVIRLGRDICTALAVCHRKNIFHRDIKPENIFVNDNGDYKLGDFGVARSMESLAANLTRKGTYNYMAPEIFNEELTDADIGAAARADLYSLGLVLYRLMNRGKLPFVPEKQLPTPEDRREAVLHRMKGESFDPPSEASGMLARVIMKACAHDPSERFTCAEEMRQALEQAEAALPEEPADDKVNDGDFGNTSDVSEEDAKSEAEGTGEIEDRKDKTREDGVADDMGNASQETDDTNAAASEGEHPGSWKLWQKLVAVLLAAALLSGLAWLGVRNRQGSGHDVTTITEPPEPQQSPSSETSLAPKETPKPDADDHTQTNSVTGAMQNQLGEDVQTPWPTGIGNLLGEDQQPTMTTGGAGISGKPTPEPTKVPQGASSTLPGKSIAE